MIKKIKVYNRGNMELIAKFGKESGFPFCDQKWHLVSIFTGDGYSPLYLTQEAQGDLRKIGLGEALSMCFWDITDDPRIVESLKKSHPDFKLFSTRQAGKTVQFLKDRMGEPGDDVLVLHCDAGISRSGAVATFACELYGIDYWEFKKDNPNLCPNPMVLRMLRDAAGISQMSAFAMERNEEIRKNNERISKLVKFI